MPDRFGKVANEQTTEQREKSKVNAQRNIRNALWESTNYLEYEEWHNFVLRVIDEVIENART